MEPTPASIRNDARDPIQPVFVFIECLWFNSRVFEQKFSLMF
jgi:hypothetical protein